ncbi:hypothetical protein ABS71_16715 [bacterium SCN 62-11]|nr:hypothetical protein [Candidatus Eremiobacteraeota bacterium]ODT61783.1 MAG: hypothetical protein ABS71_16715 [bacterium SCN 62-11]
MSVTLVAAAACVGGLALIWQRKKRRPPKMRRVRRPRRLDLADLKALGQKRVETMRDCRLRLLEQKREGDWLRLLVRVEPPNGQTRWWPWAVSVECPEQLALRDAAQQGEPLQGSLPRRVEGHERDAWLSGPHSIAVLVQPPAECNRLELGYYGHPACHVDL